MEMLLLLGTGIVVFTTVDCLWAVDVMPVVKFDK